MALYYHELVKTDVVNIIRSADFNIFLERVISLLGIEDLAFRMKIEDCASDSEGFPKPYTNASTIFLDDYTKVKDVVFYLENIVNNVNQRYYKLSTNVQLLDRVLKVFVKFSLVHEMVHIQQMKLGKLTKVIIKEEEKLPYKKRPLEIEANLLAAEITGSTGEFELIVADSLSLNRTLDCNLKDQILELHNRG